MPVHSVSQATGLYQIIKQYQLDRKPVPVFKTIYIDFLRIGTRNCEICETGDVAKSKQRPGNRGVGKCMTDWRTGYTNVRRSAVRFGAVLDRFQQCGQHKSKRSNQDTNPDGPAISTADVKNVSGHNRP